MRLSTAVALATLIALTGCRDDPEPETPPPATAPSPGTPADPPPTDPGDADPGLTARYEWPVWIAPLSPADRVPAGAVDRTRRATASG